ncbi:hypothetical protein [Flavobacterium sp.]|uniref:hypothetical protein n=1 Tax=Flavobacterium sp. TaxID=239 RepID=UPI002BA599E7|nr:hypothetical protein [Flavobacterium sp.]HSD07795.1 hypothetical protein [Flavobacterium sp.]
MKVSAPSLILFFVASILSIIFRLNGQEMIELYLRSTIIPSLFIYYLVSNNYKISVFRAIILFALFIRDVLVVLKMPESPLGSFVCVLFVYILLLYIAFQDFESFKFDKNDLISVFISIVGISTICYSVLNLKLENLELDFSLYVFFGIILSLLSVFSVLNYIKNSSDVFFNALLMCVCFVVSDIFFVVSKFYFYTEAFALISLITQFLSYFFMVNYFLEKNKEVGELNNY